ncbi:hypothetical protein BLOT_007012 [Blomia tropicalis]|nr:hypothetical protein BLOT_007012 [Blomia tropicalis]
MFENKDSSMCNIIRNNPGIQSCELCSHLKTKMVRFSIAFKSRINNNWSNSSNYWYTKLNVQKQKWYDVPVNSNQESTTIGHQKQKCELCSHLKTKMVRFSIAFKSKREDGIMFLS